MKYQWLKIANISLMTNKKGDLCYTTSTCIIILKFISSKPISPFPPLKEPLKGKPLSAEPTEPAANLIENL
jgi:hypothetical protein